MIDDRSGSTPGRIIGPRAGQVALLTRTPTRSTVAVDLVGEHLVCVVRQAGGPTVGRDRPAHVRPLRCHDDVVRVHPKLMGQVRDGARTYGGSDPIDVLAVAPGGTSVRAPHRGLMAAGEARPSAGRSRLVGGLGAG
jgi:hypothetical protein